MQVFLNFDYIIAGEYKNDTLGRQLDMLKTNYWKKIPTNFKGLTKEHRSKTLVNILRIIERTDLNTITIDKIAQQLNLSKQVVAQEIRDKFKMNFVDFKLQLLDYYRQNYPTMLK